MLLLDLILPHLAVVQQYQEAFAPLLIPAAVSAIMGTWQTIQSHKGLNALNQQKQPEIEEAPELRNAYSRMLGESQYGFSPEETGAYRQDVAQQGNMAYRKGVDIGGGSQARALNAGIGAMGLNAANQFAAKGAGLKLQKTRYADTLAQALQHQQNLKQQQAILHRRELERAYGVGMSSGLSNIAGGLETAGLSLYGNRSPRQVGMRGLGVDYASNPQDDGKGYTDSIDLEQNPDGSYT